MHRRCTGSAARRFRPESPLATSGTGPTAGVSAVLPPRRPGPSPMPRGCRIGCRSRERPSGAGVVVNDGPPLQARTEVLPVGLLLTVEGTTTHAVVVGSGGSDLGLGGRRKLRARGVVARAADRCRGQRARTRCGAPCPAPYWRCTSRPATDVEEGEALLIVEAMKMEYTLSAPRAGRVARVRRTSGTRSSSMRPSSNSSRSRRTHERAATPLPCRACPSVSTFTRSVPGTDCRTRTPSSRSR